MWTKSKSSHTDQYPSVKSLLKEILNQLVTDQTEGSWSHFEVKQKGGLFRKNHSIEIALDNSERLLLNLSAYKKAGSIPEHWKKQNKTDWIVPVSEVDDLINWCEVHLKSEHGDEVQLKGWIDGI